MAPPPKIHVKPWVCSSNSQQITCSIVAGKSLGVLVMFEISPPVFYLLTPAEMSAVKKDLWK